MNTYYFDIVVKGIKIQSDEDMMCISDLLFESGCDDAGPASYNGTLYVSFQREAQSYDEAVMSAISDIEKVDNLQCVSVDTDIVNLSDVAKLSGLTRSALARFSKGTRGKGNFPTPVSRIDSATPLWKWSEIAEWLESHKGLDCEVVEQARFNEEINFALSIRNNNSMGAISSRVAELNKNNAGLTA